MTENTRANLAAKRYLQLSGRQIIEDDWHGFIVVQDNGGIAFCDVFVTYDGMSIKFKGCKREVYEEAAYDFLQIHDDVVDVPLRYDMIELFVCGDGGRALVRHIVDASLEDDEHECV